MNAPAFIDITPSELMEIYDHCKDLQKYYDPPELRKWIEWHWLNDLMLAMRDEAGKIVGAAFIWRLLEGSQVNGSIPLEPNITDGTVSYIHFAYVLDPFRDNGKAMARLLSEGMRLFPWAKTICYDRFPAGKRSTADWKDRAGLRRKEFELGRS